ncbi:D-2-hydroxyacid dehydrogenase [Vibrio sp. TH_r3]|uniref:D-2-hydroxyacid dehydrogenase n=1 Tax=Vibrio sp. TH_r3 TaxID=3082084 RepID=UPI002954DB0A|nr:D-2-hydroxyacid dehydrogenase [Vibrio sp. TH_r3]MDV7106151.1 D-2-hydroxyacid dehydrogenase [Vibrio sp. TH_r3]
MDNFNNKLRILTKSDSVYLELFEKANLPGLIITEKNSDANIVLAAPPILADCIDTFSNMNWVQSTYAGVDPLMQPGLRQDYDLTNVKGIFGQQISEYVLGYCIEYFRHFNLYRQQQQQKCWQPHSYSTLAGKKLLILGTGAIGNYLAKTAASLNLHSIGINRSGIPPKESAFDQTAHFEQLDLYLADADIIVSTLPGTTQTKNMFDQTFFSHCRNALFFNVGRGNSVNTAALIEALEGDNISHAFLDVFANEPISEQCSYWHNAKVTITPHIAADSFPEQVFEIFSDNYLKWRDGFQLDNQVDFDKGY